MVRSQRTGAGVGTPRPGNAQPTPVVLQCAFERCRHTGRVNIGAEIEELLRGQCPAVQPPHGYCRHARYETKPSSAPVKNDNLKTKKASGFQDAVLNFAQKSGRETIMRLWLIRHGETEANVAGLYSGHSPTPLTAKGLARCTDTSWLAAGGSLRSCVMQRA